MLNFQHPSLAVIEFCELFLFPRVRPKSLDSLRKNHPFRKMVFQSQEKTLRIQTTETTRTFCQKNAFLDIALFDFADHCSL